MSKEERKNMKEYMKEYIKECLKNQTNSVLQKTKEKSAR